MIKITIFRDLAVFDEDGFCKIEGRIKDMIIRGGENLYPLEIEQIIYKHPDVMDVQVHCNTSSYG